MSRRSHRRQIANRGKYAGSQGSGFQWVWRISAILALLVVLSGFGLYFWMKSYLHSEDFRIFMGDAVGDVMGAEAKFEPFSWQGMDVRTGGLVVSRSGGKLEKMEAEGVEATLSLAGIRRGVWEISDLRVSQLDLQLSSKKKQLVGGDSASVEVSGGDTKNSGGFLSGLLPDHAELMSAEVMHFDLDFRAPSGGVTLKDAVMRVDAGAVDGRYDVHLSDGVIQSSWFAPTLNLVSARGKYQRGSLFITESQSKIYKRGVLTLDGELEGGRFGFFCTMRDVRSEELVPEDWKKSILGDVESKFKVSSGKSGVVTRGEIELKKGVLTALPLLDRIAAYANTRRFRRLHLSEAYLKFRREGSHLTLSEIVLASEGLVRIEGGLTVVDGRMDGRFKVGVMPGTLSHIPGAETKVFIRGKNGLLWSDLHITGTVDAPKEDLSDRMIAAAGERMFELVPETGKMALKFAHETATQLPAKAIETGVDVIREGSGVIREGEEVIQDGVRGVFDLLPGGR